MARNINLELALDEVSNKAAAWAMAMNEHKPPKETKNLKKIAQDAMAEYNTALATATYLMWDKEGDALKTVVRMRKLPHAKKVSFKTSDDGMSYFEINDADVKISLLDVEKAIGVEKFSNENWFRATQKLALLIAGTLNTQLGASREFKYIIDDAARTFEFPAEVKPNSPDGIKIALQCIFDAILLIPDNETGDNIISAGYHATAEAPCPAWRAIRDSMTRQGKDCGSIAIGNTAKMAELVLDCMHVILTNGDFSMTCD